jgi:hypothetical protein
LPLRGNDSEPAWFSLNTDANWKNCFSTPMRTGKLFLDAERRFAFSRQLRIFIHDSSPLQRIVIFSVYAD